MVSFTYFFINVECLKKENVLQLPINICIDKHVHFFEINVIHQEIHIEKRILELIKYKIGLWFMYGDNSKEKVTKI